MAEGKDARVIVLWECTSRTRDGFNKKKPSGSFPANY